MQSVSINPPQISSNSTFPVISQSNPNQKIANPTSTLSSESINALNLLKISMLYSPESIDSERQPNYITRNSYSQGHSSYPSQPPSIQENMALFERLPMDTLFFAFYYQPGTYQQYLAARQLKKVCKFV
jgi:CCR4-NOT transcription complex subunit 3